MFEHLDDPRPWTPDRDAAIRRGRQLRRRRLLGATAGASLAAVVLAGAAGALYVDRHDEAIDRVDVATPAPSVDGAVNVLVVGTDTVGGGGRSDTMAVLRLGADGSARALFVPRDLWDSVAGTRINQAATGGPQAAVDAVVRTTGVPVDHYLAVDFAGFVEVVDAVGGLDVAVAAPVRDLASGLALEPTPCTTLDGPTSLALVRSRHLETLQDDGNWHVDPRGDLGRIDRAGLFLAAAFDDLVALSDGPLGLDTLSRLLADHAVVDDGLTLGALRELAGRLAAAGSVASDVVPVVPAIRGNGAAVLELAPDASGVFARYGAPGVPSADGPVGPSGEPGPIAPC